MNSNEADAVVGSVRALFRRFSGSEGAPTSRIPVLFKGKRGNTERSILGSKSVTRVFKSYGGQEFVVIVSPKGSGMQVVIKFPIRRMQQMTIFSLEEAAGSLTKIKAWLEFETKFIRPPPKWGVQLGFA